MFTFERITSSLLAKLPVDSSAKTGYAWERARILIPFVYYFVLFRIVSVLGGWEFTFEFPQSNFSPGWSLAWTRFLTFEQTLLAVKILALTGVVAGAFFYKNSLARILAFIGVLEYHALIAAFGPVDHGWIFWIWVIFIFIFLPNTWGKKQYSLEERKKTLFIFWSAQTVVLLMYSLAGFGKIYGAVWQLLNNQVSIFAPDALALHISDWFLRTGTRSALGPLLIDYPLLGWPFFLGSIYVHFFSLWIAFKPELHRIWGSFLVLIHLGIFLSMGVVVGEPFFLIPLLFFNSPFQKPRVSWKEMLSALPLFGWGFAHFLKRSNLRLLRSWS